MHRTKRQFWVLAAVLFFAAQVLYVRCWFFGLTNLDDRDVVVQNGDLLAHPHAVIDAVTQPYLANVTQAYYRPIVNLSFVLDAWIGGNRPFVYHLTNTVLHGCACVLLFGLLIRLAVGVGPAALATLLFAVHPIHASSVAWIPGRNDVLLGCFVLASLMLLSDTTRTGSVPAAVGHAAAFAAALLTKETAVLLPVTFIVLSTGLKSRISWSRLTFIWLSLLGAYFTARAWVTQPVVGYYGGLLRSAWEHRAVLIADAGKVMFPVRLQVMATHKDVWLWPGLVAVPLMAVAAWTKTLRRRVLFLALTLMATPIIMGLLASNFILLENRLYLACVGLCIGVGELLRHLRELGDTPWRRSACVASAIAALFAVRTVTYSEQFRDSETYARAAIKAAPGSYLAMRLNFVASMSGRGQKPSPRRPW